VNYEPPNGRKLPDFSELERTLETHDDQEEDELVESGFEHDRFDYRSPTPIYKKRKQISKGQSKAVEDNQMTFV